ncbi:MAG: response regulator transcription factor [Bacteroidota bacterium]|nr:response regulator transcription factor [Bacteroidota bacterium]MDP4215285.1 response regulator transcription factor [Bacteroidota bacterium]MDP4245896.1 response regulator transcription factor [Bacteroidota bacterium]MDP4254289.1 response regulator transcription factor [Bacteroidota bacterium]MDP4259226.1 response regulator transcription factor [Bacteroidota bacterium]
MQPQILLADDHSMIRKGLKLLLQLHLGFTDIHEVPTCHDLMKELIKKKYSHLVLDIIFSDGSTLEILPNIRRLYPDMRIMVFSMQPAEVYGVALKQYGIQYYLSKTTPEEDTIRLLRQFLHNEQPVRDSAGIRHPNNPFSALAPRELEILHYVLKGMGTKEIAQSLNVKMNTISTVKNRIFEKTTTANLKELLELASLYNVNY